MILRLLLAALMCTSMALPAREDNILHWNPLRRLSWNDFQGVPPRNATNAALTSSGIQMRFTTDGEWLHTEITCDFEQDRSWGRVRNDLILAHEQGHFDITEIHARKLNRALKAYQVKETVGKDVNAIYQRTMDSLQVMQSQYDAQTNHSRNPAGQKSWLHTIEKTLEALQPYADYQ